MHCKLKFEYLYIYYSQKIIKIDQYKYEKKNYKNKSVVSANILFS